MVEPGEPCHLDGSRSWLMMSRPSTAIVSKTRAFDRGLATAEGGTRSPPPWCKICATAQALRIVQKRVSDEKSLNRDDGPASEGCHPCPPVACLMQTG